MTSENSPRLWPESRSEALAAGLTHYFTGKPCKRGHSDKRYAATGQCVACQEMHRKAGRAKNKKPKKSDEERKAARLESWRKCERSDKRKEYLREYFENNKGRLLEQRRAYVRANAGKYRAYRAARRAAEIERTPPWLTTEMRQQIATIYSVASRRSVGGAEFEVDHIVPLRGETVSGLHVPWNLMVRTARSNRAKGNKLGLDNNQLVA